MREKHALVIIGAGPAGLAAAATAASQGVHCVLIDQQSQPGGQIYRAVTTTPLTDSVLLGADYWRGRELTDALKDERIDYRPGHAVWQLTSGREIGVLSDDSTYFIDADQVILATGAQERPCPIEGWTLPGVMGAGAAQILLKTSGLAPSAPVVLAGSGPLLYLVAAQYIRMNVPIAALLETTPRGNYLQALKSLRGTPRSAHYLWKGWNLRREIQKAGVRHVRNVTALRAEGAGSLSHVSWKTAEDPGRWQVLSADTLLLHQGVVPNTRITRALGVDHDWDRRQMCWHPRKDVWGESSIPGIRIAGDGGGIGGASAAELDGRICALGALGALGRTDAKVERHGAQLRRRLGRELTIRPFLDALYKPAGDFRIPPDHVMVCRCEEVYAKQIRELTLTGCAGPNQMKAFTRCGMGPCQGQMCGLTVSGIMADVKDLPMDQVGYYRLRPPFKPLTLEQLANAGSYETADPQGTTPQA